MNADTNQEIARTSLGEGSNKQLSSDTSWRSSRVLLFAKLFRGKDRWVLQAVSEPRKAELRRVDAGQVVQEMIPPTDDGGGGDGSRGGATGTVAPQLQEMDRWGTPATEGQLERELGGDGSDGNKPAKKAKRSYLVPAVAIGTAAGIAAAVALFGPDPLDFGSIASDVFGNGVNWDSMVLPDVSVNDLNNVLALLVRD